jgi:glycosyltransferase involved in cell wall biosynthesis
VATFDNNRVKVLVVGQTPPPYGGQAVSIQLMLDGKYQRVQLFHVRLAFSGEMNEIGKVRIKKLWHLLVVIGAIVYARFRHAIPILYYVPAGPERVPMYRDLAILLCTRWLFKKTIFQFRAAGISELYGRLFRLERVLFRKAYFGADLGISLSEFNPPDGEALQCKRNIVVYNGLPDHYPQFAQARRPEKSQPVILFVGVLRETKGILVLLDACHRLRDEGVPFTAKFIGKMASNSFRDQVDSFLQQNHLEKVVEFLGVRTGENKWEAFAGADIFVFPSFFENEGMSRVVLEAMHFELPVVATRWRGMPSMVADGKSGFLVPIKDSQALAEKIALLLTNPKLRHRMGKLGREIYLERFTAEKFWRNMEESFLSVID